MSIGKLMAAHSISVQLTWEEIGVLRQVTAYCLPAISHNLLSVDKQKALDLLKKLDDSASLCAQSWVDEEARRAAH